MSRMPRIVLPGHPHHVVHRGHNRRVVFHTPGDYSSYLDSLCELKLRFETRLLAYCLMPNHVHLLLAPKSADGMALLMKRLAGRHAARLNTREKRSGAIWQGRYYSSLVARGSYLRECYRYIELNPIRAALVADPEGYRWSSCRYRTGAETAPWLEVEDWFMAMGQSSSQRWLAYRDFLREGVPAERLKEIRAAVHRGQLTGGPSFGLEVAPVIGRLVTARGPGRPRKK